jgi:hypothetical protein
VKAQQQPIDEQLCTVTTTTPWIVFGQNFYPLLCGLPDCLLDEELSNGDYGYNMMDGSSVEDTDTSYDHSMSYEDDSVVIGYNNYDQYRQNDVNDEGMNKVQEIITVQEQTERWRDYTDSTVISFDNDHDMGLNSNKRVIDNINSISTDHSIKDMNSDSSTILSIECNDVNEGELWEYMETEVVNQTNNNNHHEQKEYGYFTMTDVLLGKGAHCAHHFGNQLFLKYRNQLHQQYRTAVGNKAKRHFQQRLIESVYDQNGRFMERVQRNDIDTGRTITYWVEVTDTKRIYLKAAQALREGHLP